MATETWAIVAGGGTAGHLLPGLSVANALVAAGHPASTIHFVGAERGPEAGMVPAAGFTVDVLPGRGIQRRFTVANLGAVMDLVRALARGISLVRKHRPSVVVVLGGYASAACGIGAVVCRVPLVLVEQNKKAGAVNRLLRRFATASAVSFEGTDLPRATVTGNPLRPEMRAMADRPDPVAARIALGLPADRTVIVVFSGSLGSRRINDAVAGLVARWSHRSDLAVRHVTGKRDFDRFQAEAPQPVPGGLIYQVVPYEDRVHLLLDAGDLAVTRSGGTVFELMAAGIPSILVPLPIATRGHQLANALAVVASGGAVMVPDAELTTDRLEREVTVLLADPDHLAEMGRAMRAAARIDAAEQVADVVERVARG
ncbi:MAG: UDP-N-acetylglucosamine--N-acetylmuramyl-(pentapeptide) pyrophosphoryl-undecaprenol N-acetylglucosamine transferase [Aquihabitans sp.]